MRFRRSRQQDEATIEITPLIDVVFLLLIFFMVTTTFTRETQLQIDLPESQSELRSEDVKPIEILIDQNGSYAINDQVLLHSDIDTLKSGVKELGLDTNTPVVLTADAETPHQSFIIALDAVAQMGYYKVSITTQTEESE